jgi:hypothetical protein
MEKDSAYLSTAHISFFAVHRKNARELIALCGFARRSSLRTQSPAVFSFSGAGEERRFDYLIMTYVEIP